MFWKIRVIDAPKILSTLTFSIDSLFRTPLFIFIMKSRISTLANAICFIGLLFIIGVSFSCNNTVSAAENELEARYDTIFDVRGPVKSVTYSITNNFDNYYLNYFVSRVEFTSRGHRWNIIGNKNNTEVEYFEMSDGELCINFIPDKEEELIGIIDYSLDSITQKLKSRIIQCAPEFDGCELTYFYDGEQLSNIRLTDFVFDPYKNDFNSIETLFSVKDSKIDEYGNWTMRELVNGKKVVTISRTIDYYTEKQIIETPKTFEGDSIKDYEVVGDFNGDGKMEKAWVKGVDDMDITTSFINLKMEFSDTCIEPVQLDEGLGYSLFNVGDINGDGCDDIGMIPWKMTSMWTTFHVWGSKKGANWKELVSFTIRGELLGDDRGEGFIPIMRKENGDVEICEALYGTNDEPNYLLYYYKIKKVNIKN